MGKQRSTLKAEPLKALIHSSLTTKGRPLPYVQFVYLPLPPTWECRQSSYVHHHLHSSCLVSGPETKPSIVGPRKPPNNNTRDAVQSF
ncbi:hypothetical protein VNO77_20421 [Canavalia gladiata]|uniref:Uncharacterized protein n=1 Tax=Canavalia gladiata TaxID=3824 RepID=A0AAN9QL93_CANGL